MSRITDATIEHVQILLCWLEYALEEGDQEQAIQITKDLCDKVAIPPTEQDLEELGVCLELE